MQIPAITLERIKQFIFTKKKNKNKKIKVENRTIFLSLRRKYVIKQKNKSSIMFRVQNHSGCIFYLWERGLTIMTFGNIICHFKFG